MANGRRILVCGLGKSGTASVRLARHLGLDVVALDTRTSEAMGTEAAALEALGAEVRLGTTEIPEGEFDQAVVSPGLPPDHPLLATLRARGIPLESEVDFGWRHRPAGTRTLALTGSNGKTSLVKALAELLDAPGAPAVACGNYGLPVAEAVLQSPPPGWLVIELSSFQLETTRALHPDIAILLNLLPNHLDRHGTMEEYMRLKSRLFANQTPADTAIFPADARELSCLAPSLPPAPKGPKVRMFSNELPLLIPGSYFDNPVLRPAAGALFLVAEAAGRTPEEAQQALLAFKPLPHRNALVREWRGVRLVDDSKATNLAALIAGLRMQPPDSRIRLIAGGRPKETDFSAALPELKARVACCYLIGEAAPAFQTSWADTVPCTLCGDLDTAFAQAVAAAQPGETILLAPACTAFDQFASYAVRGEHFASLAQSLPA